MKEKDLKKIISKSTIETSDDFIDTLMNTIEINQKVQKTSFWWSFKPVLIISTLLILIITFLLFKLLSSDVSFLSSYIAFSKIPILVIVALISLYYINTIIKLRETLYT